jgi:hypothetical protein
MISDRKPFGQRAAVPAENVAEVLKLKRSHMVVIAAAGLVAVATGFALSRPEAPVVQERTAATPAAETAGSGNQSQQSTGSRIPLIIPIPIPSASSAVTPGMAQPSAQNAAQRGGFGETARSMSGSSGHVSASG